MTRPDENPLTTRNETMKKITFTTTDKEHDQIKTAAEYEGLTPSQYAKRATFLSMRKSRPGEKPLSISPAEKVSSPISALYHLEDIRNKEQEHFVAISLDGGNQIVRTRIITIGLVNQAPAHPREIFRGAIKDNAVSIIIAHNHPSDNVEPSRDDMATTERIKKAGEIIGIPVLDHIIVGPTKHTSFKELGAL